MGFELEFDTTGDAFLDDGHASEVARILKSVADSVEAGNLHGVIHDVNGNRIGRYYAEQPTYTGRPVRNGM